MHQAANLAFACFCKEMLGMKKIRTTFSFLAPLLFLSVLLAWPLSSETSLEASTTPMIAAEHVGAGRLNQAPSNGKNTFGSLPESVMVVILLAGTGIIGLVCINRDNK
jgi:hypothetical protein